MLVRERLLGRLRGRWYTPITVVSAPAGYGKTTLLAQAVAANAAGPLGIDCWLTCQPGDGAASALGAGLCEALGAAPPPPATPVEGLAAAVTEAMWRRSPQQVSLVLDDVQEVGPGSEGARLLAAVVAGLPANGHLVLGGRGAPPVALARLEVEGRVARIDDADLTFDEGEVGDFAALRDVPAAQVAGSAGWPAMAELSASAPAGVAAAYVGEEVLAGLAPTRRRALALLAHLGPFDDELATRVLEVGPGDVDRLVAGLPLVSTVPGGERVLHHLWRTLLAGEVAPDEVARLRRRAAALVRRRGEPAAAVRLLLDVDARPDDDADDELAAAIVDALGAVHPPVPPDVLADWLGRLPPAVRSHPGGRLLAAVVTVEADPEAARLRLEDAAAAFRDRADDLGELACLVQLGQIAWWSEKTERLVPVAARLFALEADGCAEAAPLACLARAIILDIGNDSRGVLAELDRIPPDALNDVWRGAITWFRSVSLMHLGDARAALDAAEAALGFAGPLHLAVTEGARIQAEWFLGQGPEVRAAFPAVVEGMVAAGYRNYTALAAAQCAIVHAHHGEADRAAGFLAQARAVAASPDAPLVDTTLALAGAAVAVATGDEAGAAEAIAGALDRHPLGQGHSAAPQQRCLALIYVLEPASRPGWDAAELGPAFVVARDLARAVVAARDRGRLPADAPLLPDPAVVAVHLPAAWAAEVGLAAVAAGRDDEGWTLLGHDWPTLRPPVAALAGGPDRGRLRSPARTALRRLAVPPAARLELRLLGPVELWRDGAPVTAPDWRRERVRLLLAYLALHGSASRERLGDDLWPALDAEAQSRNLRVTLTYLLRVLEPDRASRAASFYVQQDGDRLTLRAGDRLAVDLWAFDDHERRAADANERGVPGAVLDQALRAVELWRGEATELVSQPWALAPLEQRRQRFAALATRAGELLLAQGNPESAQALAERALTADPWMEAPHRLVVAANHARGDDLAARRALARYREAIHEIGLSPDEATLMVARLLDESPASYEGPA